MTGQDKCLKCGEAEEANRLARVAEQRQDADEGVYYKRFLKAAATEEGFILQDIPVGVLGKGIRLMFANFRMCTPLSNTTRAKK